MSDDDIGTVRWFGDSWGAPMNDPRARIDTPTHRQCLGCFRWIESDAQGVQIAASPEVAPEGTVVYHLDCFLEEIGVPIPLSGLQTDEGGEFYGYR
jgi:hypothetical protein